MFPRTKDSTCCIVSLKFECFISFLYNNHGPVFEEIILIEMLTEVPIILERAYVTLSMGKS